MESRFTFTEVSQNIEEYYGVCPSMLQKIGVFTIVWGMFESGLELTVLAVAKEEMDKDKRPSTDANNVTNLIKLLREKSIQLEETVCNVSKIMCDAVDDLLVLRNAIDHGRIVPGKPKRGIGFINNPTWLNVERKRGITEVHLTDQLLEKSIEAVAILHECSVRLQLFAGGLGYSAEWVVELASEVDRARYISSVVKPSHTTLQSE